MIGPSMPLFRTPRARLLARIVFYTTVLLLGIPLAFSQVMLRSYRQATRPAPPDCEELRLPSDGLRLRAWLFAGSPARPAVVVVHGLGDTIESYEPVARRLRWRGHTTLLVELRGHGQSDGSGTALGALEHADVRSAMDLLRRRGLAGSGLVLLGHSMGAVAALRAAAEAPDVAAVVVEAPYDTYRESIAHHSRLIYGLPRWLPFVPIAIAITEWRAGFDADDVDCLAAARRLRAPLYAIADGADDRMPEAVVRRVYDAHPGPKAFWVAPGAPHVGAMGHPEYWPRVEAFLRANGL
jgi:pimeloyl-ACP methyl ester carboxylesterase